MQHLIVPLSRDRRFGGGRHRVRRGRLLTGEIFSNRHAVRLSAAVLAEIGEEVGNIRQHLRKVAQPDA
jgi:hypothetical protein